VTASAVAAVLAVGLLSTIPAAANADARCGHGQTALAAEVCAASGDARGAKVLRTVQSVKEKYGARAVLFGVWQHGKPLVTGALGTSMPGVRASSDDHVRIGNVTESMMTTVLMKLVERHKIALSDTVAKWLPDVPHGDQVTILQLANGTSGYASFYTDAWTANFRADPFRHWTVDEEIAGGADQPLDFAPGTNWRFSDTNFMILGKVLEKAGGAPFATQLTHDVLAPLDLGDTAMTTTSAIPSPVLHGYDAERGDYQDSTFWSISWAANIGNTTSTIGDLAVWARALGKGTLLTSASHKQQFAPTTAGLGSFTDAQYYALGMVVSNGWIISNPNVPGYWDAVAYLPSKDMAIVLVVTAGQSSPQGPHYAIAGFDAVADLLTPSNRPQFPYG
jgi:CubicO group peptidase (beta-lactamase class C family)